MRKKGRGGEDGKEGRKSENQREEVANKLK
jgi:hypothetical protein